MCALGEKSPNETARKTASASAASTRSVFLRVLPVIMVPPPFSAFYHALVSDLYRPALGVSTKFAAQICASGIFSIA